MKLSTAVLAFLACVCSQTARAELTECNGVWTNRPCEGQVSGSMSENTPAPLDAARVIKDKKSYAVTDLRSRAQKAKKESGLDIAVADVETLCFDPNTSLMDCKSAATERANMIEAKLLEAKSAAKAAEKKKDSDNVDNVTQINIFGNDDNVHSGRHTPGTHAHDREARKELGDNASVGGSLDSGQGRPQQTGGRIGHR